MLAITWHYFILLWKCFQNVCLNILRQILPKTRGARVVSLIHWISDVVPIDVTPGKRLLVINYLILEALISLYLLLQRYIKRPYRMIDFTYVSQLINIQLLVRGLSRVITNMCLTISFGTFSTWNSKVKVFPHYDSQVINCFSIPGLTWHANHTMHHKLPYKKTTYGNTISFLFFSRS